MVPSVSVLLEYGFCTPTMNSQEYPPDTILTMSLDLNFSPWEKKVINNENKKKMFWLCFDRKTSCWEYYQS